MKICLYKGCGKYENGKTTFLTSEDLELEFVGLQEATDFYVIAKNGKEEIKLKVKDGKCVIKNSFLKSGILKVNLIGFVGEEKVFEHKIEDLILKEFSSKIEAIPQVDELMEKVDKFTEKVDDFVNKVEKVMKMLKVLCDIDIEIGG